MANDGIRSITIKNFRGFDKEISFNFEENKFILLTAPNGSGKTSLIDAIEWCFTGNIKRLYDSFESRTDSSERETERVKRGLLKHQGSRGETKVNISLAHNNTNYLITRTQNNEGLNTSLSTVLVTDSNGVEVQNFFERIINIENFYNYNVCNMSKTHSFLGTKRKEMGERLADFTTDYGHIETICQNLTNYNVDIDKAISALTATEEGYLQPFQDNLSKHSNAIDILPYNPTLLYHGDLQNIDSFTIEQLNRQKTNLLHCGYNQIAYLCETLLDQKKKFDFVNNLIYLRKEFVASAESIEKAQGLDIVDEKIKTTSTLLSKLKHTLANINKDNVLKLQSDIIQLNVANYNANAVKDSMDNLKILQEESDALSGEIKTLESGNKILSTLTTIAAEKEGLLNYRKEMHENALVAQCPICMSKDFSYIEEDKITSIAQNYQADHNSLIATKKHKFKYTNEQKNEIISALLTMSKQIFTDELKIAQDNYNELITLKNTTSEFFTKLKDTKDENGQSYSKGKLPSIEDIDSDIQRVSQTMANINFTDYESDMKNEITNISDIIGYQIEHDNISTLQSRVKAFLSSKSKDITFDTKRFDKILLNKKIAAIDSCIKNNEYHKALEELTKAKEKHAKDKAEEQRLRVLKTKVTERRGQIQDVLTEMKSNEYERVGPYLSQIFKKLSRAGNIAKINIEPDGARGLLRIVDENGISILNRLSDGQLSVFVLSYFIGNIFSRKSLSDNLKIYLIDDITSCMDDINMLAFLDFIKYQLNSASPDSAISQLFFSTCDERIQALLDHKLKASHVQFKLLDGEQFSKARQVKE